MRSLRRSVATAFVRRCVEKKNATEFDIAPRRASRHRLSAQSIGIDPDQLKLSLPQQPEVTAEFSTSSVEQQLANMSPVELEALHKKIEAEEAAATRVLREDSVYQMEVSVAENSKRPLRVFWRDVRVVPHPHDGWFGVALDGRATRAFESRHPLIVPSEAFALACAIEWAEQEQFVNKLLMPLTDLASGALRLTPHSILCRIDYLLSFFRNDNIYFREPAVAAEQDSVAQPAVEWMTQEIGVKLSRVVGVAHPPVSDEDVHRVRQYLIHCRLNSFQTVALCVAAQMTASLTVPLAMFAHALSLEDGLRFSAMEEQRNTSRDGSIKGYHDLREADVRVKVCAAATAWQLMKDFSPEHCREAVQPELFQSISEA